MAEKTYTPPRPPSPFVGRKQELEWLFDKFAFGSMRNGETLCLLGEAGIGKTALISEFLRQDSERDHVERLTPVWLNCNELVRDRLDFDKVLRSTDIS
jgi:ABC-type glutathione transport system ATPase component